MRRMRNITPFLWFDDKAEEAANFYAVIFRNAKVGSVMRCHHAHERNHDHDR